MIVTFGTRIVSSFDKYIDDIICLYMTFVGKYMRHSYSGCCASLFI